jgi:hypothetical protein
MTDDPKLLTLRAATRPETCVVQNVMAPSLKQRVRQHASSCSEWRLFSHQLTKSAA